MSPVCVAIVTSLETPNRSPNRYPRGRSRYTSKVKCFTLQPAQNPSNATRNRIVLGLRDSNDSFCCDYEQRPIMTKPKEARDNGRSLTGSQNVEKLKGESSYMSVHDQRPGQDGSAGSAKEEDFARVNAGAEDSLVRREKQNEEKIDQENSVTFYSSEQNEENSKAFIESLGSWINDLFNVPSKNPRQSPQPVNEDRQDSVLEEDPEYLKSISAIKEQFRRKLKSETSIQVSTPEKPFLLNFDRVLDKGKSGRSASLPPTTPPDWLDEWNESDELMTDSFEHSIQRYNPNLTVSGLIIRTNDDDDCEKPGQKTARELNSSMLVKGKKRGKGKNRHDISDLEEYVFPTPSELSKRILLNVNESEKCGKIYKNTHLGMQESQHYGQRKSKAHQTNARCYTTTANDSPRTRKPKGNRFSSQYCTTAVTTMKGTDEILRRNSVDLRKNQFRKPSKKEISEITRDSMTFLKVKNTKPLKSVQVDTAKFEGRTSSDELVKYLMKKIKTVRPHNPRNRANVGVTQLLSNPRNRFMQSATNTLVSVMSKSEAQGTAKSQKMTDSRPFPGKELILKNDIRVDVSRAIANNKYSRLSYLLEDNRMEDDSYLLERGSFRNAKRTQEETQKRDSRKNRFNKREEVKNMLSKIDKYTVFPAGKKAKGVKKNPEEELNNMEVQEEQNARFQKQHELFRTTLKLQQQNANAEQGQETETKTEVQVNAAPASNPVSLSSELTVIDANVDTDGNTQQSTEASEATVFEEIAVSPTEFEYKMEEFLDMVEKPGKEKQDKPEKMFHTNSLEFLKDDSKMMLSPLEKLCMTEQPQRETPKTHETPLCPAELGQVKPAETLLLNRKFSTNTVNESRSKTGKPVAWCGPSSKTAVYLTESEKEANGDKKEAKEKKKVKTPKMSGSKDPVYDSCGFERGKKKPGPNCEKDE